MNHKSFLLFLFIFFANFSLLISQEQIWDIYTFDNQPYSNVVLDTLNNDTLYLKTMGNKYEISLESIKIMKRKRESKAKIGTLAGMVIGGTLMNLYSRKTTENQSEFPIDLSDFSIGINTGLGVIGGGLIGYLVGAGLGTDEYYNFSNISLEKKKKIIEHIITRNLQKPY